MTHLVGPSDRRFGFYVPKANGTLDIVVNSRVLTQDNLKEFREVVQVVFDLQPLSIAATAVERNHAELVESVEGHRTELDGLGTQADVPMPVLVDGMTEISRRMVNFLASASSLLSQLEGSLRHRFEDGADQIRYWVERKRNLHASSFAYQFLYELRNYSQHYGLPISNLRLEAKRSASSSSLKFEIDVLMRREDLLGHSFKWKRVRELLMQQPDEFDVMPLTLEYLRLLQELSLVIFQMEVIRLANCSRYFDVLRRVVRTPDSAVPLIFIGPSAAEGAPPGRYERIPMAQHGLNLRMFDRLLRATQASAP